MNVATGFFGTCFLVAFVTLCRPSDGYVALAPVQMHHEGKELLLRRNCYSFYVPYDTYLEYAPSKPEPN